MNRSIILEGSDNVGKSTFAQLLSKLTGLPVRHMTKPDKTFDFDYVRKYRAEAPAIFDRFHLGGLVYGYYLNLHYVPPDFHTRRAALRFQEKPLVVILYSSSKKDYVAKWGEREQMFKMDTAWAANMQYRRLAQTNECDYHWDVAKYGWPDEEFARVVIDAAS